MTTKISRPNIAATGVQAGNYTNASITVNSSGQITSASSGLLAQGIQGIQGGTGLAFTVAKMYASVAALTADTSPSNILAGQFAIIDTGNVGDVDNSKLYLWNGTSYQYINDLSGTAGIQGISGYIGQDGVQGVQGLQGTSGYIGQDGVQGTQGIQGLIGTGIQGIQGISSDGVQGIQGIQGISSSEYLPQNSQSASYTLQLSDAGKHLLHPSADTTARTWIIPQTGTGIGQVDWQLGTVITFINQNGGGVISLQITTDTLRLAVTGATGTRSLAANGIATCIKITSTEWIISGLGIS